MRRAGDPITDLRRAIDALPARTREAMLEGIRTNPIIVGAYTDNQGGICPMLAAHRNGGRTTLLAFARSWDRFSRTRRVRRATQRELRILESQLTASLLAEEHMDLRAAIADHEALAHRREARAQAQAPAERPVSAEADGRTYPEIAARRLRPGRLGRLRPVRRADAERALARLDVHAIAATRD